MQRLSYLVRPSSLTENSPVIFLAHGYGSNEHDLFSFNNYLDEKLLVISLQAPNQMAINSYCWYPLQIDNSGHYLFDSNEATKTATLIQHTIKHVCRKYAIDENKICYLGFSQGAIMGWLLLLNKPGLIKHLMAISGYIPTEIIPKAAKKKGLSVYATHGTADEVIPINLARTTISNLKSAYSNIDYHEFPDSHNISKENFDKMLLWLNEKISDH